MATTARPGDESEKGPRCCAAGNCRPAREVGQAAVGEHLDRREHTVAVDRAAAWVTGSFGDMLDRLGRA